MPSIREYKNVNFLISLIKEYKILTLKSPYDVIDDDHVITMEIFFRAYVRMIFEIWHRIEAVFNILTGFKIAAILRTTLKFLPEVIPEIISICHEDSHGYFRCFELLIDALA